MTQTYEDTLQEFYSILSSRETVALESFLENDLPDKDKLVRKICRSVFSVKMLFIFSSSVILTLCNCTKFGNIFDKYLKQRGESQYSSLPYTRCTGFHSFSIINEFIVESIALTPEENKTGKPSYILANLSITSNNNGWT